MSADMALQIIAGRHLTINELGLWPHPPVDYDWLVSVLASRLAKTAFFPPLRPGEPVESRSEALIIENCGGNFVGRAAQLSPLDPSVVQKADERQFSTAREAAAWYLRWQLGISPERLPARLDGWIVA